MSVCIALFRAFLVQVTASSPHTTGLHAVSPDMARLLGVVTLLDTNLGFQTLNFSQIMQKNTFCASQGTYYLSVTQASRLKIFKEKIAAY
jgi:hypothetical protein